MWKFSRTVWLVSSLLISVTGIPFAYSDSLIDTSNYRALTSDRRAYRIGEPLVVLVVESTSAESAAGTGARADTAIELQSSDNIKQNEVGIGLGGHSDGSGQTTRRGRAFTQLSTRITEILPNGLFRIAGEQNLVVNGENQKVVLSGVVRAEDISKDNTLLSNRIAEASIEIAGDGVIDDAQRQNIIYRVLSWLGLI